MSDLLTTEQFVLFWNGWPSQWHPSPFEIGGVRYVCAEQFMMAEKARVFGDADSERLILQASHPREQKSLGRSVRGFDAAAWNSVCLGVVFTGNAAKFSQNADLREQLMGTVGRRLVEASPVDAVWGIGLDADDPRALDPAQWRGTNWLGVVLDRVRDHLAAGRGEGDPPSDAEIHRQVEARSRFPSRQGVSGAGGEPCKT